MASVTSLDKDLRQMRLDKYTPAAANQARSWIESVLGERLPGNDLLDGLKDGVALCKLINLAVGPPGVKFKQSAMPFVQMENISHFLRVCQQPPLNLHQHDVFLTVDLYEQKDPTQVLQCLGAFSRAARQANPSVFPTTIGETKPRKGSILSPQSTGPAPGRNRGFSNASNSSSTYGRPSLMSSKTGDSGRWSPTKSPTGSERVGSPTVSSWSNKNHEGVTSPAWNIAQYGYMGGASQGNLGVAFGGRRQITSAGPHVPNLADKERRRKEMEAEGERQRQQFEEEERMRKAEEVAEEERIRKAEARRWEDEARKLRAEEKRRAEEEKRRWEEEERQWKLTEEKRRRDEEEAEAKLEAERRATRSRSKSRTGHGSNQPMSDSDRIKDLERQLELARQREYEYEEERERRHGKNLDPRDPKSRARSRGRAQPTSRPGSRPTSRPPSRPPSRQESFARGEREVLKTQWDRHQEEMAANPTPAPEPALPPRPLPVPAPASAPLKKQRTGEKPPVPLKPQRTGGGGLETRPLPVPSSASKKQSGFGRPIAGPPTPQQQFASPVGKSFGRPIATPPTPQQQVSTPIAKSFGRPIASPPTPQQQQVSSPVTPSSNNSRPLPQPKSRSPFANRTDRHLANNQAPASPPTHQTYSRELGATAEQDAEDLRRQQSQQSTKAGGWASKSLLEREMEMERQRQREWEESQKETAQAVRSNDGVDGIGGGIGGKWDVNQWTGFTGGDSQNKGGAGIGAGRRQIVGPRPLPGRP
ncbi:calponin [Apiospora saccharicola]|uniref:Calponin n=1 Tax=Apiospora saccharicola TaxID=335842 RepID=A0ABR1WEF4_9PEZI